VSYSLRFASPHWLHQGKLPYRLSEGDSDRSLIVFLDPPFEPSFLFVQNHHILVLDTRTCPQWYISDQEYIRDILDLTQYMYNYYAVTSFWARLVMAAILKYKMAATVGTTVISPLQKWYK
jgi:hypothetical protein